MVVLSVAFCTKAGKPLVSRQFVEMTRMRLEGLLVAFSKLLEAAGKTQHTYVESDTVRYVYHPLDSVYLVLVTTKSSNIVQDLETVRLLTKLVPGQLDGASVTEASVLQHAFDLIFALDEVFTADGHAEGGDLAAVKESLAMDSHEERLANLIKKSKEAEAEAEAVRKAASLRKQRAEDAKRVAEGGAPARPAAGGRYSSVSASTYGSVSSSGGVRPGSGASSARGKSSYGGVGSGGATPPAAAPASSKRPVGMKLGGGGGPSGPGGASGGGMRLGGAGGNLASMMAEEGISMADLAAPGKAGASAEAAVSAAAAAAAAASADQVTVSLEEHLTVTLTRDGEAAMNVKGALSMLVAAPEAAKAVLALDRGAAEGFAFQNNPNTDKAAFAAGSLSLKGDKAYPVGKTVGLLRWRKATKDADQVPLTLNVWPEAQGDGTTSLNIEYTLQLPHMTLHDVMISLPVPPGSKATVTSEDGDVVVAGSALVWSLDTISEANASGVLEAVVAGDDEDAFFPVEVAFTSSTPVLPLAVTGAAGPDGAPLRSTITSSVVPDSYAVQGFV